MKILSLLLATGFVGLIAAAAQAQSLPASVAFRLDEKDLIPDGITHDSRTGRFFLSSIYKEKVVVGDDLFSLADTGLGIFLKNQMNDRSKLQSPTVLKYNLAEKRDETF